MNSFSLVKKVDLISCCENLSGSVAAAKVQDDLSLKMSSALTRLCGNILKDCLASAKSETLVSNLFKIIRIDRFLSDLLNKKHLKNVGPIRHNEPPHANSPGVATVLSHTACASMSTTTTTTTTRDRGDRYGPMEWAQKMKCERFRTRCTVRLINNIHFSFVSLVWLCEALSRPALTAKSGLQEYTNKIHKTTNIKTRSI